MKRFLKLILLLSAGICVGVGSTLLVTKRRANQRVPYNEVVVQPTRKTTIKYSNGKYASFSYKNPKKRLCVVTYLKYKKGYAYALYQLTELPVEEQK